MPPAVLTLLNRRLYSTMSNRSPCRTVAVGTDFGFRSWRRTSVAGPTYASPRACVRFRRVSQEIRKAKIMRRVSRLNRTRADSIVSLSIVAEDEANSQTDWYCSQCNRAVNDPLVCGDCTAVICRRCGTPLERAEDLGIG